MNKIEEIEQLRNDWRARRKKCRAAQKEILFHHADGVSEGLSLAIGILNQPSNTQMHMDTKPCDYYCNYTKLNHPSHKYCCDCGRALSQ